MNFENSQLIQQEISYQNKTYHSILARRKIEWVSHFDIFRSKLADKINFQTFNASLDLKFHRKKSKRNLKFPILATNPESHFKRKITLDDPQKRLQKFRKYAYYANKAYCIKNKGGMVGPGIYARAEISGNRELIIYLRGYDYNYDEEELVNFNMWRPYSNIPQAQVVAELYQDFLRAKKTLMEMISSLLRPQFHVRLAGFGVGGGMYKMFSYHLFFHKMDQILMFSRDFIVHAVFTALELKMTEYYLDIEIYTFGQLRMGNLFFTHFVMTLFPNKIYRITHSHDRVPQLPERKNLEGHWHFDREYWITYSDNCECVDTSQMFVVYECIGPLVDGYIHENPHCNAGAQITNFSIDLSHSGPYFGQNMGMCPPSLEDDFDDI
ncbi:hypothetical protein G9A89_001435 [Geosiphon pyriformis]|nr:hypothetical protein G9A89_001435 [Geosiphon pyriformis]